MPARPEFVRLGRLALSGLARARPVSSETLGDLKLALTEACAIRRSSDGDAGTYEIHYELHADRLVVELSDDGEGFVLENGSGLPEPGMSEPAVGLGIIRALADELEIGRRDDGYGSRLRFVKRFDD